MSPHRLMRQVMLCKSALPLVPARTLRCYSALMDPAWMWLDAAEDIAFGVDILLSVAAALARDLRLVDAPADGSSASRGEPVGTLDEKAATAPGAEQGARAGQPPRSAGSAAAVQPALAARRRPYGSCDLVT